MDLIESEFIKIRRNSGFFGPNFERLEFARFIGWFDGSAVVESADGARDVIDPELIVPLTYVTKTP